MKKMVWFAFIFITGFSSLGHAKNDFEGYSFSPFVGRYAFDHQQKLDVSPMIGLRLGYPVTPHFKLEGVLSYIPTESNFFGDNDRTIHGYLYHVDALYHFTPNQRFVPFLAAGMGALSLDSNPRGADTNFMANYGAGAKYAVTDRFSIRGDVRFLFIDDQQTQHNMALTLGLVYAFGGRKKVSPDAPELVLPADSDGDGVADGQDRCSNTAAGVRVDELGCPVDSDGDGVADFLDQCPDSPAGGTVNDSGCLIVQDLDTDGVEDGIDRCPETPAGDKVDSEGCPEKAEPISDDADRDGVNDTLDFCPGTPKDVTVDHEGCPVDTDTDGVPDHVDACPDTPKGLLTDGNGCTLDTDRDGVSDSRDRCADTPQGVQVSPKGCPLDGDGDQVADYLDQCPDTAAGATVDEKGCPKAVEEDTDGDGVTDDRDRCPNTLQGAPVDVSGCMEVKDQTSINLSISFDTGKARIKPEYDHELRKIADFMKAFPETTTEVEGHTDNTGSKRSNRILSQRRADSVRQYLISRFGIDPSRLSAMGYGAANPIADNTTPEGREKNRRVVIILKADAK